MSGVEFAEPGRGRTFPDSWGPPRGRPYSQERQAWITANIERRAGGGITADEAYGRLAARDRALLASLRLAELRRRLMKGPGQ